VRLVIVLACALVLSPSCATRRAVTSFRVLPAKPDYLLRSPDSKDTPFPEVLGRYTNVGLGWVELRPQIELRVENAYFREGAPKRGLALSRLLAGVLYEISSADPVAYLGAGLLLLAIGAVASARPAWRAATGDPLQALRTE
jgi:hypothetical protein